MKRTRWCQPQRYKHVSATLTSLFCHCLLSANWLRPEPEGVQKLGASVQQLGAPVQKLGVPVQKLGVPVQKLGAPVQKLGAPVQKLGAPVHIRVPVQWLDDDPHLRSKVVAS
jgi:hypothetical protein